LVDARLIKRMEQPDPRAGGLPECAYQGRRTRHAHVRFHPSPGRIAADLGGIGRRLAAYIETCIAAFGPDRAIFESNFPVDKGSCSYAALWNAFKRIAAVCSAAEKGRAVRRHRDEILSPGIHERRYYNEEIPGNYGSVICRGIHVAFSAGFP
jgi:hypothetical protein